MGYFRGLTHGAVIGAVLGLLYAPDSGQNIRRRVSRLLGQAEETMAADRGVDTPSPSPSRRRSVGGTETRARRP